MNRRKRLAHAIQSKPTARRSNRPRPFRPSLEPLEDRQLLSAVTWTIDQAQSSITAAIPDQPFEIDDGAGTVYTGTLQVRNQSGGNSGPWNVGNTAPVAGTIDTLYADGSAIQFLSGQTNIVGVNSGSYIPDPANWNGTDFGGSSAPGPGVFGGRLYPTIDQVFGLALTVGQFNFTDINYDVDSGGNLPITAGSFPANTMDIGIASATANVKGQSIILVGQILPDAQEALVDLLDTNQSPTGTITSPDPIGQPDLRQLTLPILQNFSLELSPGTPPFSGSISGQIVATATIPADSVVGGRFLFYENSSFDGGAGVDASDSAAIPGGKSAYLPGGGTITSASMSSYSRGLNGIFYDIGGAAHGPLTLADFEFAVSNLGSGPAGANNTPSTWSAAPAPTAFTVLSDTPSVGTDRVEFIWADNAIENRYLEVTVQGNDAAGGFNLNTGLANTDIFYFGSNVGDTFNDLAPTVWLTTAGDETAIQGSPIISAATIDSPFDMDRNGIHLASDRIVARANTINALNKISISNPPAAPAPPGGDDDGTASAVASALAAPTNVNASASSGQIARVDDGANQPPPMTQRRVPADPLLAQLEAGNLDNDRAAVELALDEELLDSLLDEISS